MQRETLARQEARGIFDCDSEGSVFTTIQELAAWLLWRNEIIADTTVIDRSSLPRIVMPARTRFVPDERKGGPEVR